MWRQLLNGPSPDKDDLPPSLKQVAVVRLRAYWAVQMALLVAGQLLLWISALTLGTNGNSSPHAFLLPIIGNAISLYIGWRRTAHFLWLVSIVLALSIQGMLIDGLGGLTSLTFIVPYSFAGLVLPRRQRVIIQMLCVGAFWYNIIYEILPIFPQIYMRRLFYVSYNILVATLNFQTLRFINRLTIELNAIYSRQFLARVSHELRTPLNSVLGFAKLAQRGALPPPYSAYLQQVVEEGEQLNRLVGDLLDSAHLATGKLKLTATQCDLNSLCAAVAEEVRPMASAKGLALHTALANNLPHLEADPLRLRQVVRNLAVNAVKFTSSGQVIITTQQQGQTLYVLVIDTGTGIPSHEQGSIFAPFVRGGNRPQTEGVGLGLDIARQLARLHGGDITLRDNQPQGSIFTVSLPLLVRK
jgi:signal transduction histidine kinase